MGALKERCRELRADLARIDLRSLPGLCRELKNFLRHPVTAREAEEEIKRRIGSRAERFLRLVETRVFHRPDDNPYRRLFKIAGCELADLRDRVRRYGLEKTLEELARQGVYLTPDEFKGKRDVVRGGKAFRVDPMDLDNIVEGSPSLRLQTTGTSNPPRQYLIPVATMASRAFPLCVHFAAHGLFSYSYAIYDAILPANGGVRELLVCARFGYRADRWFARKVSPRGWLGARWSEIMTYLIVLMGNRHGPGFPRPQFIDPENVQPILDWVLDERRRGKACCIRSTASNAARIARAARDKGVSLEGTKFRVSGEPFTAAKRDVIERVGARAIPSYGSEGGGIGYGCVNPAYVDDLHVDLSKFALIAHPDSLEAAPGVHPLLITTLDETSPRFYLNVDLGDYADLEDRSCGCALEKCGLTRHIHGIRSYEKFTTEGMNYFYGDLFDLLEKTLPSEFGGGPGDYQLCEEEEENGQTRLTLTIHPQVGDVSEEKVLGSVLEALSRGSPANDFQSKIWKSAGTLRIRRGAPITSARGKIQPLHISRPA